MKCIENYVYTKKLNLDLCKTELSCRDLYDYIVPTFGDEKIAYSRESIITTRFYDSYNLLLYPFPEFHELYESIKSTFIEAYKERFSGTMPDNKYYIQSWLNVYRQGEFIKWHRHWLKECNSWHGFFCVACEPSHTTYRVHDKEFDVVSENNLLVISPSDGDMHRTWPWYNKERPRITIAFDIVPRQFINPTGSKNHWIPI